MENQYETTLQAHWRYVTSICHMMELLRYELSILNNVKLRYKVMGVILRQNMNLMTTYISYQGHMMELSR